MILNRDVKQSQSMHEIIEVGIAWSVYYALHSILASSKIKQISLNRFSWSSTNYRLFYSIFSVIGFLLLIWHYKTTKASPPLLETNTTFTYISYFLMAVGSIVIMISSKAFKLTSFFGLSNKTQPDSETLYESGVYKLIRHPLYFGTLLAFWGNWLNSFSTTFFTIALVSTFYIFIGISFEEKKLKEQFGDKYKLYTNKTKMIIPFIL